ncbi:hypothetical protein COM54_22085 [Bacillus toyonensis]|uniref:hypothetical protein n=1 Tax=Bacillus toyonensis TaxID=155322 RepID=UPI000BF4270A|nr:hypothetical protein [Bacillus toyonensis]PGE07853.1 hypothetical protein COM54_22085 [Bacillus toyonensis]
MENIIGKRFKTNNCNEFIVLRKSKEKQKTAALFEVEFDKINGVKYKTLAVKNNILSGRVKNPYYSTVHGIGYLGSASKKGNESIYQRWLNMLYRCYDTKNKQYHNYGGNGVIVCDRWKSFEHFLSDFKQLKGYDENNLKNLEIDKDSKIPGNKIYSPETCMLIGKKENLKEMNERLHQKWFLAISPEGKIYKSNNQSEFAKKHGLISQTIGRVLNGNRKHHKCWTFAYTEENL